MARRVARHMGRWWWGRWWCPWGCGSRAWALGVDAGGTCAAMTASMVSMDDKVTCRRCRRPLRSARAVAAGIGERCALLALLEAVGGPVWAVEGPSAAQSVVALVTAFFEHADDQVGPLLAEADLRDVAGLLAAVTALYLQDQPDGAERLRGAGLAAAQSDGA